MINRTKPLWWSSPAILPLALGSVLIPAAAALPEETYMNTFDTLKHVTAASSILCSVVVIVFCFFSFLGARSANTTAFCPLSPSTERFFKTTVALKLYMLLWLITLSAYLLWAVNAVSSGLSLSVLVRSLSSGEGTYALKSAFFTESRVSGVTTLTQLGIPVMILGLYLRQVHIDNHRRWIGISLLILVFIALLRSLLVSERLATVELLIPALIVGYATKARLGRLRRVRYSLMPFIAAIIMIAVFTAFEYLRSYSAGHLADTKLGEMSIGLYGTTLFLGYYLTSINNTAMLHHMWTLDSPYFSIIALIKAMHALGLGHEFEMITRLASDQWYFLLNNFGASGLTNPGGYLLPLVDFGILGGLALWAVLGLIGGRLYSSFLTGRFSGIMIFPFFFIGILEMPRVLYWLDARAVPVWLCFIGLALFFKIQKSRAHHV